MSDEKKEAGSLESAISDQERRDKLKEVDAALARAEAKEVPGAPVRTSKQMLLDATAMEAKDLEHYYRYVNSDDPNKPVVRQADGFSRVPTAEAEKYGIKTEVHGMILMRQPREKHVMRVTKQKERNAELLEAHNREVEATAEAVAKVLRDKHGLNISTERLLVRE